MGKKIWLSRNPRNLGSDKIVRTKYVSISTPSCKQDSNFAFYPRVLVVNRIATLAFKEKTTTTKLILSSDLNFHVYINVHNRERARPRDKKQRRPISS